MEKWIFGLMGPVIIISVISYFIISNSKENRLYRTEREARDLATDFCFYKKQITLAHFIDKDVTFMRVFLKKCLENGKNPENIHEIIYFMLLRMEEK